MITHVRSKELLIIKKIYLSKFEITYVPKQLLSSACFGEHKCFDKPRKNKAYVLNNWLKTYLGRILFNILSILPPFLPALITQKRNLITMRHILYVFVVCFVIQGIVCPPVNQNPTPKPEEGKEDQVWIQNIFFLDWCPNIIFTSLLRDNR